jgi:hypothetical protein
MLDDKERYEPADTMLLAASEQKLKMLTPITISEDDDGSASLESLCDMLVSVDKVNKSDNDILESVNKRDASIMSTRTRPRCHSLPSRLKPKSIMKKRTIDESLHSTYGSEEMITGLSRKLDSLKFDKICIREYSRTVGDNPSCSSGPPVR